MNRRRMANASFVCALIAVFFAGSHCGAQDFIRMAQNRANDYSANESSITLRAGLLFMKRESPDNIPLVIENFGAGPVALRGSDFDFDFQAGVEASLIYDHPNLPAALEARYFWISDWLDNRPATSLTNAFVNTTPNVGTFGTMDFANYKSQLQSFELHFRKPMPCDLTLLIGFRYFSFDEDLDMLFNASDRLWWGIENDLYGFQLGAQRVL